MLALQAENVEFLLILKKKNMRISKLKTECLFAEQVFRYLGPAVGF